MAHSLGLNVVAEGAETEAQLRFLREQACDEVQASGSRRRSRSPAWPSSQLAAGPRDRRGPWRRLTACACLSCRHGPPRRSPSPRPDRAHRRVGRAAQQLAEENARCASSRSSRWERSQLLLRTSRRSRVEAMIARSSRWSSTRERAHEFAERSGQRPPARPRWHGRRRPDQASRLPRAARLLDGRDARGAAVTAWPRPVAVLAALNLAHELQQLREENEQRDREIARTLEELQRKLDALIDGVPARGRAPAPAARRVHAREPRALRRRTALATRWPLFRYLLCRVRRHVQYSPCPLRRLRDAAESECRSALQREARWMTSVPLNLGFNRFAGIGMAEDDHSTVPRAPRRQAQSRFRGRAAGHNGAMRHSHFPMSETRGALRAMRPPPRVRPCAHRAAEALATTCWRRCSPRAPVRGRLLGHRRRDPAPRLAAAPPREVRYYRRCCTATASCAAPWAPGAPRPNRYGIPEPEVAYTCSPAQLDPWSCRWCVRCALPPLRDGAAGTIAASRSAPRGPRRRTWWARASRSAVRPDRGRSLDVALDAVCTEPTRSSRRLK